MITSQQHMEKALEILKSLNIEVVRHFSPCAEVPGNLSGSGDQRFWDDGGRMYQFVFNDEGELVYNSLGI